MEKHRLEIREIGLILASAEGKEFRRIIFRDPGTNKELEYDLYKDMHRYIWKLIEDYEEGRIPKTPVINGEILNYNGLDIVLLEGESPSGAFKNQQWRLRKERKLKRQEAVIMAKKSDGYITDVSPPEAIIPAWIELDETAQKIKFRYYHNANKAKNIPLPYFDWSDWFDLI